MIAARSVSVVDELFFFVYGGYNFTTVVKNKPTDVEQQQDKRETGSKRKIRNLSSGIKRKLTIYVVPPVVPNNNY